MSTATQPRSTGKVQPSGLRLRIIKAPPSMTSFERSQCKDRVTAFHKRAKKFLDEKVDFIPNVVFSSALRGKRLEAEILGPIPASTVRARKVNPPSGVPAYIAALYEVPLLTREQECHLFRKMNYCKFRAARLRDSAPPYYLVTRAMLDEFDWWMARAEETAKLITESNLRLVISIVKKRLAFDHDDFFERVSDGNVSLIRAVKKFDYARGNKFSTYASWAIVMNFARSLPDELNYQRRNVTGEAVETLLENAEDTRSDELEDERKEQGAKDAVASLLECLEVRERRVITARFGLGNAEEQTLEQLGRELGVTKERVRQIEQRARCKLLDEATRQGMSL